MRRSEGERRGDAEACCTEFSQKLVASLQADARLIGKSNEELIDEYYGTKGRMS